MRFLLVLMLALFSSSVVFGFAEESADVEYKVEIDSMSFDYDMIYDQGRVDCNGVLRFIVRMNPSPKLLTVVRTRRHLTDFTRPFFGTKRFIEPDGDTIVDVEIQDISWGMALFAYTRFDTVYVRTPTYYIDSLISEKDLSDIRNQTNITHIESDGVNIWCEGKTLHIDSPDNIYVSVHDIYGTSIYSGHVNGEFELKDLPSIVVVQYVSDDKVVTKKMFTN